MFAYCGNCPITRDDPTGHFFGIPVGALLFAEAIKVAGLLIGIDSLFGPTLEEHYTRNSNNIALANCRDNPMYSDWKESPAWCHQFSDEKNYKLISPDGHYEAIFNSHDQLVTDERDYGTYNYASPKDEPIKHVIKDVIPWIVHGNTANDSTNAVSRLFAFIGVRKLASRLKHAFKDALN